MHDICNMFHYCILWWMLQLPLTPSLLLSSQPTTPLPLVNIDKIADQAVRENKGVVIEGNTNSPTKDDIIAKYNEL